MSSAGAGHSILRRMPRRPGTASTPALPALPAVHLARDHPSADARARVRDGTWTRVRRGAYLAGPEPTDPYARRERVELARLVALAARLTTDHVFSHASAARLWGLPTWAGDGRAHITQSSETRTTDPDLVRHLGRLAADERTTVAGLPVTTLERTLVDCATASPRGRRSRSPTPGSAWAPTARRAWSSAPG